MLLNQGNMKFINSLLLLLVFQLSFTQEKIKVDGISSVVGDFIILDSDIDKVLIDMESQGLSTRGVSKCQLLGKLMEDKLYAHHAIQDSLELSDNEIYHYVDRQLEYFTEQLGGIDKVLEFYNKRDELSFRDELFEIYLNELKKTSHEYHIIDGNNRLEKSKKILDNILNINH